MPVLSDLKLNLSPHSILCETVPPEFVVQRTNVANPPSIFYIVDQMLNDKKLLKKHGNVLSGMYPRLEAWYRWLLRSQAGKKKGTF
ncbi:hypothetical protein TELCIR_25490, partial [Teladorsagia circumcincta]